jgi:thioredoxin-related protein
MWSDTPVMTPSGEHTTARDWAEELGLFYAPSLLFFDEQGEEIIRVASVVGFYRLSSVLDYINTGAYKDGTDFQTWRVRRAL